MKWGKFGGIALLCIASALTAPAAVFAAISVTVDYSVGGEHIDYRYMYVNWTTSGCAAGNYTFSASDGWGYASIKTTEDAYDSGGVVNITCFD